MLGNGVNMSVECLQALLEVAVPPGVRAPIEEVWVGWGLVFDHCHLVDELLCHHAP